MFRLEHIMKLLSVTASLAVATMTAIGQPLVSVSPATRNVLQLSSFSMNFNIASVTNLHGYHVIVDYDNTILRYDGATSGTFINSSLFFPVVVVPHTVDVGHALIGNGTVVSGSGSLFTLLFTAIRSGTSPVTITSVDLRNGSNNGISPITINSGSVTVENNPVPIQLASFTGRVIGGRDVHLDWTTLSETNNYGFEVQKSANATANFQTLENSFVAGSGTTNIPHRYSFTEHSPANGNWYYRLKQMDLDGAIHFTEPIQVDVVAGINGNTTPRAFAFDQNYPNPFNPSTTLSFELPQKSEVALEVYSVLGEKIATLIAQEMGAGRYSIEWTPGNIASGVYFARLTAGDFVSMRKVLLSK